MSDPASEVRPILVTGGSGQLARALGVALGDLPHRVVGRPEFDFDRPETLAALLRAARPALLINAAAYTAVDRAEQEPEAAERANHTGPAILARLCAEMGIACLHVSTDYVFDGAKGEPYTEDDPPNPTGVYGASKRRGEVAVLAACPQAIVLRTSWVYGATGKNFVLTMLAAARRSGAEPAQLKVVGDQVGCPTAARDLAQAIASLARRILSEGFDPAWAGIYHASGTGSTSWHGLAAAMFEQAGSEQAGPLGVTPPHITAIATADWPTPAQRPADSRLDCSKLSRTFGLALPPWRATLPSILAEIAH